MKTARMSSTVLLIIGLALVLASPVLAVIDYNYWGGNELLPENNWTLSLPGWTLALFFSGVLLLIIGAAWKLRTRKMQ